MGVTERKLRDYPQPVVEGWDMHLYCRYTADISHDMDTWGVIIGDRSRAGARRQAKNWGWVFHRDDTATCPACAKALGLR